MASNQQQNKSQTSDINMHADVKIIQEHTRRRVHRNSGTDRNYPLIQRTREIIQRNYNGFKQIINHNYRRFSY